jgi:catechol 2,3-dioxygenase-like lactoylglutathione lyase family enzyme
MLRAMGTTTEPLVRRLNVVYLYVSEMERSVALYRDLLGIPLEGDDDWQEAALGGTRFALHRAHEGVGPLSAGTIRVNLEVADLEAAERRLREAGVAVEETMREDWGAASRIVDPDGYELFLFQPPAA